MDLDVQHNENAHKYSAIVDGEEAVVTYTEAGDRTVNFTHTVVPPHLRGQGIGEELVRQALDDTIRRGYRFTASCPFVTAYVRRHPQYAEAQEAQHAERAD